MDISERLKMLPPDGSMPIVTEKKDYKSNIMIIRCPDHLRSPSDPEFHMAIVDRSIVGTNYSGNAILDKLCPGLQKVKLPRESKPKTDTSSPPKKYAGGQKDFHSTRRGNRFSSGSRARSYHKKPRLGKPWTERTEKSWVERSDKSWMERSMRFNAVEISPWEEGKQPWNNNALGNIHGPVSTIPMLADNVPMSIDYHEVVNRPVNDYFIPHKDTLPMPPDYSHNSGVFCGPSKYPPSKGLLGDHPPECDPGRSYRSHNPSSDPLNNSFPSIPRDAGIGNDYRNNNPRNNPAQNKSFQDKRTPLRGSFPKNFFKRKAFPQTRLSQNDERNSKESIWNGNEGARHNNRTRVQNGNRRGNRGRQNYRPRKKY